MEFGSILRVAEVAALARVSERFIRMKVRNGEIPVLRMGSRCIRFERSAVEAWIASLREERRETA